MDMLASLVFIAGCVGTWYFIKKKPNKKNRNISIGLIVLSLLIIGVFSPNDETDKDSKDANSAAEQNTKESSLSSSEIQESKSKEEAEEKLRIEQSQSREAEQQRVKESKEAEKAAKKQEEEQKYAETNALIDQDLKLNQGWAMGTIDRNGNPTSAGTPNPDYTNWMYVQSIKYDGSDIDMQVTADFQTLSESDKDSLASSAQGIVMSNEALDTRPHIYVYNGENSYGGSRILSANEFKWN